jgi:hypothetical protein
MTSTTTPDMLKRPRDWLLRLFQGACQSATDSLLRQQLEAGANAAHIDLFPLRLAPAAGDRAEHLAIAAVHRLGVGAPGLYHWSGVLELAGDDVAARLALAAARSLAGRDDLLLLIAGPGAGALVDGETCARLAVSGMDPELELAGGNSGEALEASGDVLAAGLPAHATGFIVLGLKCASF